MTTAASPLQPRAPARQTMQDIAFFAVLAAVMVLLRHLSVTRPDVLPFLAPWDFAPLTFLAAWGGLWFYLRGLWLAPRVARPPLWRRIAFLAGLALTYGVVQTRFEYMAQHMFFLNRAQHVVMHHLGPFLMVLGWPGETLLRAMPGPLRRLVGARWLRRAVHVIQNPVLAAFLFVGLVALWLIPSVHFQAMINPYYYAAMNWTMIIDGLLFWALVLDPRPRPPARVSVFGRVLMVILIVPPQILIGALVVFSRRDLYDFYHWCGRLYPSIDALSDQTYGGLIIWIPSAMMSLIGLLTVLNFARLADKNAASQGRESAP